MRRRDYLDDPDAPGPDVGSAGGQRHRDLRRGDILLIKRTDNGNALPGGGLDLGESLPETAVRETREETGLDVENHRP